MFRISPDNIVYYDVEQVTRVLGLGYLRRALKNREPVHMEEVEYTPRSARIQARLLSNGKDAMENAEEQYEALEAVEAVVPDEDIVSHGKHAEGKTHSQERAIAAESVDEDSMWERIMERRRKLQSSAKQ